MGDGNVDKFVATARSQAMGMQKTLNNDTTWTTRLGATLQIAEMSRSHRENTALMLLRKAKAMMVSYHDYMFWPGIDMASENSIDGFEGDFWRAMNATDEEARAWLVETKLMKALMDGLDMVVILSDHRIIDAKGRNVCIWDLTSKRAAKALRSLDESAQAGRHRLTHAYANLAAQAEDDIARDLRTIARINSSAHHPASDALGKVVRGKNKVRLTSWDDKVRIVYEKITPDAAREAARRIREEGEVEDAVYRRWREDTMSDLFRSPNTHFDGPGL